MPVVRVHNLKTVESVNWNTFETMATSKFIARTCKREKNSSSSFTLQPNKYFCLPWLSFPAITPSNSIASLKLDLPKNWEATCFRAQKLRSFDTSLCLLWKTIEINSFLYAPRFPGEWSISRFVSQILS